MRKAFLGTGLLGSGFVRAMLKRGDVVQVWNRTAAKAKALEEDGATVFGEAGEAVRGAQRIHLTLKDDASVDEVLQAIEGDLEQGAIIIDHTTTSREGAVKRTEAWKAKGFLYQHAPVFMGPSNALDSTGYMLLSGDDGLIKTLTPELQLMTGELILLGPEVGKAAALKLAGNAFLVLFSFSLRETLALGSALDIDPGELLQLFRKWNPGAGVEPRLRRLTSDDHTNPSWELAMARKDTGLFLDAAKGAGIELKMLHSIANTMDEWIERGYGQHDWTVVGKDPAR